MGMRSLLAVLLGTVARMGMAADRRTEPAVLADWRHNDGLIRQIVFWFGINRVIGHENEAPRPIEAIVRKNAAERGLLVEVRQTSILRVETIGRDSAFIPTEDLAVGVDTAIALMNSEISRVVDPTLLGEPG